MAARSPSSVKVGGMRMSTTATSGRSPLDRSAQGLGIGHGAGDGEAPVGQQLDEPVAQDGRVLGDDDAQGTRSGSGHADLGVQREVDGDHRRATGRAGDVEAPVDGVDPVGEAGQPARGGTQPGELGPAACRRRARPHAATLRARRR